MHNPKHTVMVEENTNTQVIFKLCSGQGLPEQGVVCLFSNLSASLYCEFVQSLAEPL